MSTQLWNRFRKTIRRESFTVKYWIKISSKTFFPHVPYQILFALSHLSITFLKETDFLTFKMQKLPRKTSKWWVFVRGNWSNTVATSNTFRLNHLFMFIWKSNVCDLDYNTLRYLHGYNHQLISSITLNSSLVSLIWNKKQKKTFD